MRTAALLLLLAAWTSQAAEFQDNGLWGTVKTAGYEAAVSRNGGFSFAAEGSLKLDCSLIRSWVAWQRFPQIMMLEATQVDTTTLRFRYFWDGGRVEETLSFDARGVTATYAYTPLETRNTQYIRCLLTPAKAPDGLRMVATGPNGSLTWLDAGGNNFLDLSTRGAGKRELDLIALEGRWGVERFPIAMLGNNMRGGQWIGERAAGDTLRMSYRLLVSNADGTNLPDAPVSFRVSSGR